MSQTTICLIIFLLVVISFLWNKISMGLTALIGMMLMVATGCIDADTALAGFANSTTIMLATMFIVAAGFNKTQMVAKLSSLTKRVSGGSITKILLGYVLITALLGQFVPSAVAVFSIAFPLVTAVCDDLGISRSKIMLSIGFTAISTVAILPIGSAAVFYAQYNGYLETYQYTDHMLQIWDMTIARLPMLLVVVLYAIFIAPKFAPERPDVAIQELGQRSASSQAKLGPVQEKIATVTFILVILGLLTAQWTGIPTWEITMAGALIMVLSGVLNAKEAYGAASQNGIAMLYVGTLAIGTALTDTGAGDLIGAQVSNLLGNTTNNYLIGLVFFLVPFLLTQVMVNNAVANVFIPIAILTCKTMGCDPVGPILLVVSAATTAFLTPLATVAASMTMGLGGYSQKTMFKMGWLPAVILCAVNVLWIMTVYPAY